MKLSKYTIAKITWKVQKQLEIQLAGTGTVTEWAAATTAQQESQLASVDIYLNAAGLFVNPNAAFHTAGLTVGSTPVVNIAVSASNQQTPGYTIMQLGAATLTGATNPGDTFVVSGVTYSILGAYTAASNVVNVVVAGDVPSNIAANTAFSSYTVNSANATAVQFVIGQLAQELLGA